MGKTSIINFSGGIFYKSNNRGAKGVNWKNIYDLPGIIRNCKDSILLPESILNLHGDKTTVVYNASYNSVKNGVIDKGVFAISMRTVHKWYLKSGFYTTNNGRNVLPLPIVLWKKISNGEEKIKNKEQLKLL